MKETLIVLYAVILQLGIAVIVLGIVTYQRHKKESLKYFILFMISLQANQMQLLLKTCIDYSGKENFLLRGFVRFFELPGIALTIFVLYIFPFFIMGKKPGKLTKLCSGVITFFYIINYFIFWVTGLIILQVINELIVSGVILYSLVFIFSILRYIGNPAMRKVMFYLCCVSVLFIPIVYWEFICNRSFRYEGLWFIEPIPAYLVILSCSSIHLFRKYFDIPSYIDPGKEKLSEYFIQNFRITEREEEIITLLRGGKTYKEIAEELTIAYKTVDAHIQNIYLKTKVKSRKQLLNLIETSDL